MEPTVVERARAGDAEAMTAVLEEVAPRVRRFGLRMCRHPDDADEVVQDTLLALTRQLPALEDPGALSSWVFTLARTACARRRRGLKNQPMAPESAAPEPADRAPSPEAAVSGRQVAERVSAALETLPDEYREVLLLRDVEGLTAPEAAQVVGVTVSALKSRLHRARSALRAALRPMLEPPGPPPTEACPDVAELLSRKLEGDLAAADCDAMQAHLDRCPACRAGCDALERALAACRAQGRDDAPVPPAIRRAVQTAVRQWLAGPR